MRIRLLEEGRRWGEETGRRRERKVGWEEKKTQMSQPPDNSTAVIRLNLATPSLFLLSYDYYVVFLLLLYIRRICCNYDFHRIFQCSQVDSGDGHVISEGKTRDR